MIKPIETVVPRRKFVVGDSDETRKTATGHSCGTLSVRFWRSIQVQNMNVNGNMFFLLQKFQQLFGLGCQNEQHI
jgi:hypothetical protein